MVKILSDSTCDLSADLIEKYGICGGYNLQWAWTSGYIAGKHAGK